MNTSLNTFAALATAIALCLAGSGCIATGKDGRFRHEQFPVGISDLDWLTILYEPAGGADALTRHHVRISVAGTGEVECRTGRSPRVTNSFSLQTDHPHWNEIISDRTYLPKNEIAAVFQRFVDEGVIAHFPPKSPPATRPAVFIKGNISAYKISLLTDNPHLVSLVEEILANFPPILNYTPSPE